MTDPADSEREPERRGEAAEPAPDDEARRIILARRARFVAAALASAGIATASCGGETTGDGGGSPQPCLDLVAGGQYNDASAGGMPSSSSGGRQSGAGGAGGAPLACLDAAPSGAGGTAVDAGPDAPPDASLPDAAIPLPCLTPAIPEGANGDGEGS